MNQRKKIIETINELEDFSKIIQNMELKMHGEKGEFLIVIDGTNYSHPVALLNILIPDVLSLNIKKSLARTEDIVVTGKQTNCQILVGMITSDYSTYYTSLCRTFHLNYSIDNSFAPKVVASTIANQQLN